jgi:chromosomal replication initiator protein
MNASLWPQCLVRLAAELPEQQFNTWIRPLPPADVTEGSGPALVVTLRVPNRFKLDWIRTQYANKVQSVLTELAQRPVELALALSPSRDSPPPSGSPVAPETPSHGNGQGSGLTSLGSVIRSMPTAGDALGGAGTPAAGSRAGTGGPAGSVPVSVPPNSPAGRSRLNPALTFATLVPGRANQMARTAALHVAGAPGQMYNPLFIYGGVGLGKTHLVHSVGNALLADRPDARVLYLHAEQFITDVVRNYQRKTFDELKAKYHSLDLLLIDDVQFFAGKERTQEEFFNAFEALLAKRAHIIMTSDTYPKGLVDIDERLTSRFDAGLTVAIEPPELEMRVAILMKKSDAEGTPMPEDVAFFVAKNVRANVRELEGALRKVLAYSRFSHKDINIALAREALKDLLSIQNRQISVENIQKTVADFYKIKVADMYSKKRPASIARPRQIAMYLAKEMTQKSLPEIGELFGGRDHTTVLHAVRKIGGERLKNTELNQQLHVLEQTLKG